MIKLVIYLVLAFLIYRFYISPIKSALDARKAKVVDNQKSKEKDSGEYVDYEEIK